MKYIKLLLLLFAIPTSLLHAVCNLGSLTQVTGSPFTSGTAPSSVAYSPLVFGNLFAAVTTTGNGAPGNLFMYQVNTTTGALTAASGSPFAGSTTFNGVAFSPLLYGNLFLAATYATANSVGIYQVNTATGALTQISGSPYSTGTTPQYVAFSPIIEGNVFVAVTNSGSSNVSVYQVNTITGALTTVAGSPFSTGSTPLGMAFSPVIAGNLFAAVTNEGGGTVSVYSVNPSTGLFTQVSGSPFTAGSTPASVAFSPIVGNNLFAIIADQLGNSVYNYSVNSSTGAFTRNSTTASSNARYATYSPLINGELFATVVNTSPTNTIASYQVNTTSAALTIASGSPVTITSGGPIGVAISPLTSGGIFTATANSGLTTTSVFQIATLIPTITTLSQFILSGNSATINGTIAGGTSPYTLYWQDNTQQSAGATSFSRSVSPTISTIYNIASMIDTNACLAGASNSITIAVRTCP